MAPYLRRRHAQPRPTLARPTPRRDLASGATDRAQTQNRLQSWSEIRVGRHDHAHVKFAKHGKEFAQPQWVELTGPARIRRRAEGFPRPVVGVLVIKEQGQAGFQC
jgi:hypothetical protein